MPRALITGAGGLIGSEAVRFFARQGFTVTGVDNDLRRYFFGDEASTRPVLDALATDVPEFTNYPIDIRDASAIEALFQTYSFDLVIHAAAQPSHDWAAHDPATDFAINATATLRLLESFRRHAPDGVFIFASTNKVYGDNPNLLPLVELETRWEIAPGHPYENGIDEAMSTDQCRHSVFGASKLAADVMVQEYGRYFGLKTCTLRAGCVSGPSHRGTEQHGFLSYLVKCLMTGHPYRIYGYKGKQVRDTLHVIDLVTACHEFYREPRCGEVYNLGGGRFSHCSLLEAISLAERISGKRAVVDYVNQNRVGDHIWYISDVAKFQSHYPRWDRRYDVTAIVQELIAANIIAGAMP